MRHRLQPAGDAHVAHVGGDCGGGGGRVRRGVGLGRRAPRRRLPPAAAAAAEEPLDHGGEAHREAEAQVLLEVGAEVLAVEVVQDL